MTLSLAATALGLAAALAYLFRCWAFPYGRCWWCRSDGRNAAGYCNACHGTGRRVRLGRRLYDAARREYRDGTK
ncbi:hypothetical protein [Glycomyces albidus]|uniref:Uncharacterized protein n=1 Tax=Glycomyces albidus TaxID=2656774 RepID=A0A6L5GAJ9_9ACTN|nr:hypothetical protein [Glycomyces albidus]MQM26638.1 hypothetical protein [Glycomyces albidus]